LSVPDLAIVVPAYNEAERLPRTLARLLEYFSAQSYSWTVTVVSDGSTDGTPDAVRAFAADHPQFALIESNPNRGKGYVVRQGMLAVEAKWILFTDADLAAPIEEIEKLIPAIEGGADIAIGSRPLRESRLEVRQPWYRELLGRTSNKLVQLLAVRGIQDTQCGFKLFRQAAATEVFRRCKLNGFSFDFEALFVARDLGLTIAEVPIRWAHQEGSKVVFWRDYPRALKDLIFLRLKGRTWRMAETSE
jgi:dolichyl-phosphate beta-glucosyltransferase